MYNIKSYYNENIHKVVPFFYKILAYINNINYICSINN